MGFESGETVAIILTDPLNGAGAINFEDNSSFKRKTLYKFIASRSKSGAVNKLHINDQCYLETSQSGRYGGTYMTI
ncbi:MAG: hypothetical protein RLZ75_2319 [Pseudomonadota bacterium]|jgi:hypothetical protein